MRKKLQMLKLQIKSAFISLPKIIAGTFVIAFFTVLLSAGIAAASLKDDDARMKVGVVFSEGEEDKYVRMAFDFISEIDTVSNVCTFEFVDYDSAIRGLRDNRYVLAIVVPSDLVESILVGRNEPVEVICPSEGVNNTSMIFREMLAAGGSDLSSAEAGLYTFDDLYKNVLKNYRGQLSEHENKLNQVYLSYALNRSVYFTVKDISVRDGLSTVQFYICTAAVMLLMLSGITCQGVLKLENRALSACIKTQGIHSWEWGLCKTAGIFLVYFVMLGLIYAAANIAKLWKSSLGSVFTASSVGEYVMAYVGIAVLVYAVFSFIYCIFTVVGNQVYSVLVLFLTGMLFMYASGCFISSSLLPSVVRGIGEWLPTAGYFRLAGQIVKGTVGLGALATNFAWIAILQAVSAFAMSVRRHR